MSAAAIRESAAGDGAALDRLYARAFPAEDLRPLVAALLGMDRRTVLSLVAGPPGAPTGHCVFTRCAVDDGPLDAALLGPLAVDPDRQGRGVGSALVRDGLDRLRAAGTARVFVLGDPRYYGRFEFAPEPAVSPPCPIPDAWRPAWQSLALAEGAPPVGPLAVPEVWRDPALWAP